MLLIHLVTVVIVITLTLKKFGNDWSPSLKMSSSLDFTIVFTLFWLLQFHVYIVMHELKLNNARYKTHAITAMFAGFFLFALLTPWLVFIHAFISDGDDGTSAKNNLVAVSELFGFSSGGLAIGLA